MSRAEQRWNRDQGPLALLNDALRGRPSDAQTGKTAGAIPDNDAPDLVQREVGSLKHLLNEGDDLRRVLTRAFDRARDDVITGADRDAGDIRRRVDRQPGRAHTSAVSSTIRRDGSTSCDSRKWRSSGGAHAPARSGHSIRMIARSRSMSSNPRSRASSG